MDILVTGAAGFIGAALSLRLLARDDRVYGLDNLNDYYDVGLKQARLARLRAHPGFEFEKTDIADRERLASLFARRRFDANLALPRPPRPPADASQRSPWLARSA